MASRKSKSGARFPKVTKRGFAAGAAVAGAIVAGFAYFVNRGRRDGQ